jgi:hypothetical protein
MTAGVTGAAVATGVVTAGVELAGVPGLDEQAAKTKANALRMWREDRGRVFILAGKWSNNHRD